MTRALLLPLCLALAGCFSTERVDALLGEGGEPVPVEFRHDVEVCAAGTGEPVAEATVYVSNDEDGLAEVAWTDANGRATLVERYFEDTVRIETFRFLGIPLGQKSDVRYPTFELLVVRGGFSPAYLKFGGEGFGPRPGTPGPWRGAPLVLEREGPRPVTLTAASRAGGGVAGPSAAALFHAPRVATLKRGARGEVNGGRFVRVGAEGETALVYGAVRALERTASSFPSNPAMGGQVLLIATLPAGRPRFFSFAALFAASCSEVIRGDLAPPRPVDPRAGRAEAAKFVAEVEAAPPGDVAGLAARVERAISGRRTVAVLAPVATCAAVERELVGKKFRKVSETWIEAW